MLQIYRSDIKVKSPTNMAWSTFNTKDSNFFFFRKIIKFCCFGELALGFLCTPSLECLFFIPEVIGTSKSGQPKSESWCFQIVLACGQSPIVNSVCKSLVIYISDREALQLLVCYLTLPFLYVLSFWTAVLKTLKKKKKRKGKERKGRCRHAKLICKPDIR